MVLPVKSRMVKKTAARMPVIISPMSPICCMNCRACSASVMVRVGLSELVNSASMALATSAARSVSAMRTVNQPTVPSPKPLASSK